MSGSRRAVTDRRDESINWRRTDTGVELYDERNPDAWIHAEWMATAPPETRLFMICPDCGAVAAQRGRPGTGSVCVDCGSSFEHTDR